jgi:hypothetical protein
MANLCYPQLMSGSLAQYPIQKSRIVRTVKNVLPDGSMYLFPDPRGSHLMWHLEYVELSQVEIAQLQSLFAACSGPFRAFTFLDPTDNLLSWTSDLTNAAWSKSPTVQVTAGYADAFGGTGAFLIVNNGQAPAGISQTIATPANYQYCFSAYVHSDQRVNVTLTRSGSTATAAISQAATPSWTRVVSAGQLNDSSTAFTVTLSVDPGQQVEVCGLQLDAQPAPSRYRATGRQSGVYANAHWGVDQLAVMATYPGQFTTAFSIETAL